MVSFLDNWIEWGIFFPLRLGEAMEYWLNSKIPKVICAILFIPWAFTGAVVAGVIFLFLLVIGVFILYVFD